MVWSKADDWDEDFSMEDELVITNPVSLRWLEDQTLESIYIIELYYNCILLFLVGFLSRDLKKSLTESSHGLDVAPPGTTFAHVLGIRPATHCNVRDVPVKTRWTGACFHTPRREGIAGDGLQVRFWYIFVGMYLKNPVNPVPFFFHE